MDVLAALFTSAYVTDNNLLILHLCRMVSLTPAPRQHGGRPCMGYAWFGW